MLSDDIAMSYKVFLSHSTKDIELVMTIRDDLVKAGITVYLAEENPEPDRPLAQKILDNIKSSNCMIVLLTAIGYRSQYVNQEVGAAKMSNLPVIPLVEKGIKTRIRGLLEGIEYILFDKTNPREAIKKVVNYVSRRAERLDSEIQKREAAINAIAVILFVIIISVILYYRFRKK